MFETRNLPLTDVSIEDYHESGVRRASQLLLALAAAGDDARNRWARNYCADQLLISDDDWFIARARAQESGRLRFRITHYEPTAGAFPATEQEQKTMDLVDAAIIQDRIMRETVEPMAYDIYIASFNNIEQRADD